jgi:hypothetical protein
MLIEAINQIWREIVNRNFRTISVFIFASFMGCGSSASEQLQLGSFAAKSYANAYWVEDSLSNAYAQFQGEGDLQKFCASFCAVEEIENGKRTFCNVPAIVHIDGENNLSACDWSNDFNNSQCYILGRIQDSGDVELKVNGLNWIKVRPVSIDTLDIGVENSMGSRSIVVNRTNLERAMEAQKLLGYCGIN